MGRATNNNKVFFFIYFFFLFYSLESLKGGGQASSRCMYASERP